jgi:acyl carrier protein
MDRNQIKETVVKIIKDNLPEFADKEIDETTRINTEANFDSMTFVYIMCKIESIFDISIPKRRWEKMMTLGDVIDAVEKELSKKK